jgi:outer membrane protein assembly factor BamB
MIDDKPTALRTPDSSDAHAPQKGVDRERTDNKTDTPEQPIPSQSSVSLTDRSGIVNRRAFLSTMLGVTGGVSLLGSSDAAETTDGTNEWVGARTQPSSAATASSGWPQYQFDSGRSGVVADRQAPTTNFTPAWSIDRRTVGPPVADADTVYVVSEELTGTDPWLQARSRSDGAIRWRVPINNDSRGASGAAPPAVVNGVVYYSSGITTRAFDAATGEQRWASAKTGTGLVVSGGRLYLNGPNGTFTVLDATDGSVVWERTGWEIGIDTLNKHAVADGTLYLGLRATNERYVVALDAATGAHQWTTELDGDHPWMVATKDGVFAAADTILYALDPATGEIRWQKEGGPLERPEVRNIGTPAVGRKVVYAPIDGTLAALDIKTGDQQWATNTLSEIAVAGNSLYGLDGYAAELVVLDATTGQLRTRYQYPGEGVFERTLIPLDDMVLVGRYQYYESDPASPLTVLSGDNTDE